MSSRDDTFVEVLEGARARSRRGRATSRAWSGGAERRWAARRAVDPGIDGRGWDLIVAPVRDYEWVAAEVDDLEKRAIEANVTFSRAVIEAQYPRLAREPVRGGIRLACLWRTDAVRDERRLVLFAPVATPLVGWPRRRVLRIASNEHLPLGTPLVDRDEPEAVRALFRLLGEPTLDLPGVAVFADLPLEGEVARLVLDACPAARIAREHHRAVLRPDKGLALTAKRSRDLRRQLRNLEAIGPLTHVVATDGAELADAMEAFVALELRSWKGGRGTSLYSARHVGAFARDAVERLSREDRAAVHLICIGGRPIAGLIVIGGTSARITWKVAHDPDFAVHSPGVQILREASLFYLEGGTAHVDSIAEADHPVMDRLWAGRMRMGDVVVALDAFSEARTGEIADAIERRERWRARLKRLASRIGGRGSRLRRFLRV